MSSNYYDDHAKDFINNTLSVDMGEFYQAFCKYLPTHAKILDAGCGSGRDSLYFLKSGYLVDALDASSEMVRYASQLTGLPVRQCTFDQINVNNFYDGIWCCASLLHVPKSELVLSMYSLAAALNDTGIWYVSFKYGDTERTENGRQFTDLNEASLISLVKQLDNIEIRSAWITEDKRPSRNNQWLNALLAKNN